MIINFSNIGSGSGGGTGATYQAGDYIQISANTISVTGITPDDYVTSSELEDAITAATTGITSELAALEDGKQTRFTVADETEMNAITSMTEGDVCIVGGYMGLTDAQKETFYTDVTGGWDPATAFQRALYGTYYDEAPFNGLHVKVIDNPYWDGTTSSSTGRLWRTVYSGTDIHCGYGYMDNGGGFAWMYDNGNSWEAMQNGEAYLDAFGNGYIVGGQDLTNIALLYWSSANTTVEQVLELEVLFPLQAYQYVNGTWVALSGGGSGSDYLPKISSLPASPVDGAIYNYNGRLIKYVNGAGNWGEWRAPINRVSMTAPVEVNQDTVLHYTSIPSSMNGQLVCKATWKHYQNQNIFFFYNQSNGTLDAYSDSEATTPLTTGATISMDGVQVESANGIIKVYTTWTDGKIVFETRSKDDLINQVCSTSTNDPHYELYQVNNSPIGIDNGTKQYSKTVYTDEYGNVVGLGFSVKEGVVSVNGDARVYLQENGLASSYNLPNFYAPTASGASGTVLVSAGNTAPVWQTLQTALGIQAIWTGTQAEYEALGTYSNTTLYFIVEE